MAKILLVDDERSVKWALQQILAADGHTVETANSGEEGLLKAREQAFELVISDLRMPGISGLEMIRELKKRQPSLRTIICSAYGSMESVVEAMRLGVNDFLVKPFKMALMKEAVSQILVAGDTEMGPSLRALELEEELAESPARPARSPGPAAGAPEFLPPPALPCACAGAEDERGGAAPGEGVFFDVVEAGGPQVILFGSSPLLGPCAGALSCLIRGALRNQILRDPRPRPALLALNEMLWKFCHPRPSVSLFYGLLSPQEEVLRYLLIGDRVRGALRRPEAGPEPLAAETSPVLGLFPGLMLTERTVQVSQGDRLVLLGTARVEFPVSPPGVEESFMPQLLPETNWLDPRELARQVQKIAAERTNTQTLSELTVTVIELSPSPPAEAHREVRFSSAEQNLRTVLSELGRLGQQAQIPTDLMHDLTTALVEAVNNAQTHAYPEEGEITVKMTLSNRELILEVIDEGVGFDLQSYHPPDLNGYEGLTTDHGRSIYLIQQLMDRTLIETRPGRGTIVHMAKGLGTPPS